MMGLKLEKTRIREHMLKKRLTVPDDVKSAAEESMISRFISLASFRYADTVLFYYPIRGEIDITRAAELALSAGKRIAFPKCNPGDCSMVYKFVDNISVLSSGAYNIPEPAEDAENYIPDKTGHDICIVPAVCFDRKGLRIGYGKGYYDRFLSGFGGTTVGFSLNEFIYDSLPRGKYDKAVDIIITERGVFTPS